MGRDVSTTARWTCVSLALVLSGCVAGADGPSPTDPHLVTTTTTMSSTVTTVTVEDGLGAFRECLRERGAAVGRIRLDALGRPLLAEALRDLDLTDRDVLDALEACGQHLGSGALDLGPDPQLRDLVEDTLKMLAACLRSWGVEDFPDPVPGFDGVGSPFPNSRIPWTDPDLVDAVAACRDLATDS